MSRPITSPWGKHHTCIKFTQSWYFKSLIRTPRELRSYSEDVIALWRFAVFQKVLSQHPFDQRAESHYQGPLSQLGRHRYYYLLDDRLRHRLRAIFLKIIHENYLILKILRNFFFKNIIQLVTPKPIGPCRLC